MKPSKPEKKFKAPAVEAGQGVRWFPSRGTGEAHGAIVAAVYPETVDLFVVVPSSLTGLAKVAVRHKDDPNHVAIDNAEQGVWDHLESTKQTMEALGRLTELVGDQGLLQNLAARSEK